MNIVLIHSEFNRRVQRINIFHVMIVIAFENKRYDIIQIFPPINYLSVRSINHDLFKILQTLFSDQNIYSGGHIVQNDTVFVRKVAISFYLSRLRFYNFHKS